MCKSLSCWKKIYIETLIQLILWGEPNYSFSYGSVASDLYLGLIYIPFCISRHEWKVYTSSKARLWRLFTKPYCTSFFSFFLASEQVGNYFPQKESQCLWCSFLLFSFSIFFRHHSDVSSLQPSQSAVTCYRFCGCSFDEISAIIWCQSH